MQYGVDPTHQSWEKGLCAYVHYLCTLCMNRIYAWFITSTTCWKTLRTTIICNIESIQATKIEKKANVHMCTIYACRIYAHYAYIFNCAGPITTARCWEIFRTVIICDTESIKASKAKKMAKKIIFALFCTIYAHYAYILNYAWTKTSTTCWETFRTIIICNMELIRATKVEKKANVHMCTIYAHCAWTGFMHELKPAPHVEKHLGLP